MATTKQKKEAVIKKTKEEFSVDLDISNTLTELNATYDELVKEKEVSDSLDDSDDQQKDSTPSLEDTIDSVTVDEEDKDVVLVNSLLDRYKSLRESKIVTEDIKTTIIRTFVSIMRHCISQGDNTKVLDTVVDFFTVNKNSILSPMVALAGLEALDKDQSIQLATFYNVFSSIVEKRTEGKPKVPVDIKSIRHIIKDEKIMNYIAKQFA